MLTENSGYCDVSLEPEVVKVMRIARAIFVIAAACGYIIALSGCEEDFNLDWMNPPEDSGEFIKVSAGHTYNCGITAQNKVKCWNNSGNISDVPTADAIDIGSSFGTCVVNLDESLDCWGFESEHQLNEPTGSFSSVEVGDRISCVINEEDAVECWDLEAYFEPFVGTYVELNTGFGYHVCGIDSLGEVVCWGDNEFGQISPPSGSFTKIRLGEKLSCALNETEEVVCWGDNADAFSGAVNDGIVDMDCGADSLYVVHDDGRIGTVGHSDPIIEEIILNLNSRDDYVEISVGFVHACGLTQTGDVLCYGKYNYDED